MTIVSRSSYTSRISFEYDLHITYRNVSLLVLFFALFVQTTLTSTKRQTHNQDKRYHKKF